jgi:hypothetical protein
VSSGFQAGNNRIKPLREHESVTQILFINAVLTALMYGRSYDVITQNGDLRENNVHTLVFQNKVHYQNASSLQNSIWRRSTSR